MISCDGFDPLDPYMNFEHWAASYGGSLEEDLNSAAIDEYGFLYGAGHTTTFGAGNGDAWLIKAGAGGSIAWQKAYNYDDSTSEYFRKIKSVPEGNLTVLCDIADGADQSFAVLNIEVSGDVSWFHLYDGNKAESAADCIRTPVTQAGYMIAGRTNSVTTLNDLSGEGDAFLLAVDDGGNYRWQKLYGGPGYDEALVVLPALDGGVYLAGNTASYGNGNMDYWLVRTDGSGTVIWQKAFGGTGDEFLCAAAMTSSNTILLAGISTSSEVMYAVSSRNSVYWILCLNDAGNIIWQKTYHDPRDTSALGSDTKCAVQETKIPNRYLFACSASVDRNGSDYCLLILKNDGSIKRQNRYGGPDSDYVKEVVYMQDHCCCAIGTTRSFGGGNSDYWFLKALPDLKCTPLSANSGFLENEAGGASVPTQAQTRTLESNFLEKLDTMTWTITDTQCTRTTQAP